MRVLVILFLFGAVVTANPRNLQRIVGGTITTISSHPSIVSPLYSWGLANFNAFCAGTIVNQRTIVTAAHCTYDVRPLHWRVRVGSSFANSEGTVHFVSQIINHPDYNSAVTGLDNDIAIIRTSTLITFVNNVVQPSRIAGPNYYPPHNTEVWAAGWGAIYYGGPGSPQLRHVQVWVVGLEVCRQRYGINGVIVADTQLCTGWLDVGGRGQCQGDSGGPVYHDRDVLVGVTSWGHECGHHIFPGVSTRVSSFSNWIVQNS